MSGKEVIVYGVYAMLIISIIYVLYCLLAPQWRKLTVINKAKKYKQKYKTQAIGEVIGKEKEKRTDWFTYCVSRMDRSYGMGRTKKENFMYYVYSPIVRYEVEGVTYEINAEDYTRVMPILGRKALVVYSDWNPADACVWIKRKYRKHLKVWKRDEDYFYCAYGLKKNIRIPIAEVEEHAVPGRFLVHKYGFYHLEQPEELEKTFAEMLENPSMEKRDEYK